MRTDSFKTFFSFCIFFLLVIFFIALPNLSWSKLALHEALYYQKLGGNKVQCHLCPRNCLIPDGKRGFCGVRENQKGVLYTLVYAKPCAIHIDPIEKKPLFHFLPQSKAFSIATVGCNLRCKFCQNWEISQALPEEVKAEDYSPAEIIQKVKESGSPVIAYTYTEPTIFFEYMFDIATLARTAGIKNVMHSSGFINEAPLRQLCPLLDAANIDLKGFSEDYYSKMTLGTLKDVLRTLTILKEQKVHLEITTLLLPGMNDSDAELRQMCLWIHEHLGDDVPLHFSRFYPMHKLTLLSPTPVETLERARDIAREAGLHYVYIGNVPNHPAETTYCPRCGKALIKRNGYSNLENNIKGGKCAFCNEPISGVW